MSNLKHILLKNRAWAESTNAKNPEFLPNLAKVQTPKILWIGCSDSRVPPSVVAGCAPGELFVHRNVANQTPATDLNFLSVLQFAVCVLKVEDVVVCGHYECGGVFEAMSDKKHGLIDNWLSQIKSIIHDHSSELDAISDYQKRYEKLCEMNVEHQVERIFAILKKVWQVEEHPTIHGLIYDIKSGLLKDLGLTLYS